MAGPGGGGGSRGGGGFGGGSFGGGSHGGGGFGGGSFGGSHGGSFGGSHNGGSFGGSHGGGFGGHHHAPPPPHHHGPHFHGPFRPWRRTYIGGGFGGGCFSIVVIALFVIFGAIWLFIPDGAVIDFSDGVSIQENIYDEATMQSYANDKYMKYFGNTSAVEDNILLVLLTNEECDGYYTIAWVGDNVDYTINDMFGEYSEYGTYLNMHIDEYFAYSLDTDLAQVIKEMTKSVTDLGLDSSFNLESDRSNLADPKFVNLTTMDLTPEIVNSAIEEFTDKTGIPMVIVVDSYEKVFDVESNQVTVPDQQVSPAEPKVNTTMFIVIGALVVAVAIGLIAFAVSKNNGKPKAKKEKEETPPWEQ